MEESMKIININFICGLMKIRETFQVTVAKIDQHFTRPLTFISYMCFRLILFNTGN